MKSPTHDELVAFLDGRASARDAETLFSLIAEDPALEARVRAIRRVRGDFTSAWDAFTDVMAAAGDRGERHLGSNTVLCRVRALLDGAHTLIVGSGVRLREAIAPARELQAAFAPVLGTAGPDAGIAYEHARRASELIGAGQDERAHAELRAAAVRDASVVERAAIDFSRDGTIVGRAHFDAAERTVTLTLEKEAVADLDHPVAILHAGDPDTDAPRVRRFELVEDRLAARFANVPDGILILEIGSS